MVKEEVKGASTKLAMSNLDVAAAVDEIRQLCVGGRFSSLFAIGQQGAKDHLELKFEEVTEQPIQHRRNLLRLVAPNPSMGVDTAGQAEFLCRRDSLGKITERAHEEGHSVWRVRGSTVIISPFNSINGLRCHLKSVDVENLVEKTQGKDKSKLAKSKFADEVTVALRGCILVNVQQVANDRVVAFQFAEDAGVAGTRSFTHSRCPCSACDNQTSLLQASLGTTRSCTAPEVSHTLFVEQFAGNVILVDSTHCIVTSLYSKSFGDKSDPRSREKGLQYQPYYHNNISAEALWSINALGKFLSSDTKPIAGVNLSLPSISARLAIDAFAARSRYNKSVCLPLTALQALQNEVMQQTRKGNRADGFQASLDILVAASRVHLTAPSTSGGGNRYARAFDAVFSSPMDMGLHPTICEAIRKGQAACSQSRETDPARQRDRCFTFTTTIQNSNEVGAYLSSSAGQGGEEEHVSHHPEFASLVSRYLERFSCCLGGGSVVNLSKVLVSFLLGMPIVADAVGSSGVPATATYDLTKLSGDAAFEILKRCLSQFDNMGPVLAAHVLTSAWADVRAARGALQNFCNSAAEVLASRSTSSRDLLAFLSDPLPCHSPDGSASLDGGSQLAYATIRQSLYEVAERETTNFTKRGDLDQPASNSLLTHLANIRLHQRLLNTILPGSGVTGPGRAVNDLSHLLDMVCSQGAPNAAFVNALLSEAPAVDCDELTTARCIRSLCEALPIATPTQDISDALCEAVIECYLAPYVADACVLMHHRFRYEGDTFIQDARTKKWIWAGYSYSPIAAQGVTFFGERSLKLTPPSYESDEIRELKNILSTRECTPGIVEVQHECPLPKGGTEEMCGKRNVSFEGKGDPNGASCAKRGGLGPAVEVERMRFFTEQEVVTNPFAYDDGDDSPTPRASGDVSPKLTTQDLKILPTPVASYESYCPALRCLSDVAFGVRVSVAAFRQDRQRISLRYGELAQRIEESKAYLSDAHTKPFLYKTLGGSSTKADGAPQSSARTGVQDLGDRLEALERKRQAAANLSDRLYILPGNSTLADNSPVRPPMPVSATLPAAMRSEIPPTPPTHSPHIKPCVSPIFPPMVDANVDHSWSLSSFVNCLAGRAEMKHSLVRSIQSEYFDFMGVGRSLEYFYLAAHLAAEQSKRVGESTRQPHETVVVLAAAPDSSCQPAALKKKIPKATDMVENTLRKHEARKSSLEQTAKGYHVNGNTLIMFAEVVNSVLTTIATLVSQGSSWSAIEETWQSRRKAVLDEAATAQMQEMIERGYDGRCLAYEEMVAELEAERAGRSRLMPKSTSVDNLRRKVPAGDTSDSDTNSDIDIEYPAEDDVLSIDYYYEHQDELDPPPSTKEELIERVFGDEPTWVFKVITGLNLAESIVTVSLPKVVDDEGHLQRDPEMIDIDVNITESAYSNANIIFKRKKETDVKVSKARQADALVMEGALRRAMQRQQSVATGASKKNKGGAQASDTRRSFKDDILYQDALQSAEKLSPSTKINGHKEVYVPLPVYRTERPSLEPPGMRVSGSIQSSSSLSPSFARSQTSNNNRGVSDPILWKRDESSIVPPVEYFEGVRVRSDAQDPMADSDCKSFWFLTNPENVVAVGCDLDVKVSTTSRFLVLHPRDAIGAIKLLNEELSPWDVVVFTEDPAAEGALPVIVKSRTVSVNESSQGPVQCRIAITESAIQQASCMLFARSKLWAQRKSGRAFWCYGAQLLVRSKEEFSFRQIPNLYAPVVLSIPFVREPTVTVEVDHGTFIGANETGLPTNVPLGAHSFQSVFSCFFFTVVRGELNFLKSDAQPLRLGIGLLFKEKLDISHLPSDELMGEDIEEGNEIPDGIEFGDLLSSLASPPNADSGSVGTDAVSQVAAAIRAQVRRRIFTRQQPQRELLRGSSDVLTATNDPTLSTFALFTPTDAASWTTRERRLGDRADSRIPVGNITAKKEPSGNLGVTQQGRESPHLRLVDEIGNLIGCEDGASVEAIMKHLKGVSEHQLQQFLLYLLVTRKSSALTKEEKSRETQRKKKDSKKDEKGKRGKKEHEEATQKSGPLSDYDIIALQTATSTTLVESVDKDLKKLIKQREGELHSEQFSESESDADDDRPKSKKGKKVAPKKSGSSRRHLAIRMIIADECIRTNATRKVSSGSQQEAKATSSERKVSPPVHTFVDILNSRGDETRLDRLWNSEFRWLTGSPQFQYVGVDMQPVNTTVDYCIPIVAPIQSLSSLKADGSSVAVPGYKYFVELQPFGNEKSANRASDASGKKGGSNFKTVFSHFCNMISTTIASSYRTDYWSQYIKLFLSSDSASIAGGVSGDDVREWVETFTKLGWNYYLKTQESLVANRVEAALLERCAHTPNAHKYFQRMWEVSTSVSELADMPLRAAVIDCAHSVESGPVKPTFTNVVFIRRTEGGRLDFNCTISKAESRQGPALVFGTQLDSKKGLR